MTPALVWSGLAVLGAASWFIAAVVLTRIITTRVPYCHQETRIGGPYKGDHAHCKEWHVATCWRTDATPGVRQVLLGSGLALVWPLILPLLAVAVLARPAPTSDAAYIARLECELQIDGPR